MALNFFLLVVLLLWFQLASCNLDACDYVHPQYYISKAGEDSPACYEKATHLTHPCANLSYLLAYSRDCSYLTIFILDEETQLNGILHLESNIIKMSLIGNASDEKQVTINCEPNSGLYFSNTHSILLKNLRFSGCYFNVSEYASGYPSVLLSSIVLHNTYDTSILQCMFESTMGSAVLLDDARGYTTINGSTFKGNLTASKFRSGGVVIKFSSYYFNTSKVVIGNSTFNSCLNMIPNKFDGAGGAIQVILTTLSRSILIEIEDCHFNENYAQSGGAVGVFFLSQNSSNLVSVTRSHFNSNYAKNQGGAVLFSSDKHFLSFSSKATSVLEVNITSCDFVNNTAMFGGGLGGFIVPCSRCNNSLIINLISTTWIDNHATTSGFAVGVSGPSNWSNDFKTIKIVVLITGHSIFSGNGNIKHEGMGAVSVKFAELGFLDGTTIFIQNEGSAIVALSLSKIFFQAHVEFTNNTGVRGGAMYMMDKSEMFFDNSSIVLFEGNEAYIMGGAIYTDFSKAPHCAIVFWKYTSRPNVTFRNNKARGMDQSIYIADAKSCINWDNILQNTFQYFPSISNQLMYHMDSATFDIVSVSGNETSTVSLGEHFHLKPTTMWDTYNRTSIGGTAYIVENSDNHHALKLIGPSTVSIDNFTHEIEFYIAGSEIILNDSKPFGINIFFPRESTYRDGFTNKNLTVVPCYLGYEQKDGVCKCVPSKSYDVKCHSATKTFCVKFYSWYSTKVSKAYPCPLSNCNYTFGCPKKECNNSYGFCAIQNTNDVCKDGREDVLCSLCSKDYSFSFEASKCVRSSSCKVWHTCLLMLTLVGYWVVISVAALVVLSRNLSVGSGFMYGVVYYFSVITLYVRNNQHFTEMWFQILMNICTALTQLDPLFLGDIKWCFVQSWRNPLSHQLLRYVTLFFIVGLILFVVFVSRHCRLPQRISFAENSPIHAICMLVLFSYTSLSCTSFRLLIPIFLEDEWKVKYAPSYKYFHDHNHIPYVLVALVVEVFLSLPICFFFLLAPRISRRINLVKYKLKPILDEFHACFRPECRWFAGFYFLARQMVYLVDGLFTYQFPERNSVLTTLNAGILIVHATFQPYSNVWLNRLDTLFLLDILLLSLTLNSESTTLGSLYNMEVYFHKKILPYFLVLLPMCYLFGILVLMFVDKKWALFKIIPCFTKLKAAVVNKNSREDVANNVSTEALLRVDSSSYEDDKLREELLEDDPISIRRYGMNYGAVGASRISTSSVRLQKPPRTL